MTYMAGDYYAGDYYAGGLLSGIGSMLKGAVKTGVGFVTGGPGGAARALAGHAVSELATHKNAAPGGPSNLPALGPVPGVRLATHNAAIDTFLRGGGRFSRAGKAMLAGQKNAALQPVDMGMHPALMGFGRRGRRMNWANSKALSRAERRIHSAVKHMTKYIRWVHPARAGHAAPKFGRKKRR